MEIIIYSLNDVYSDGYGNGYGNGYGYGNGNGNGDGNGDGNGYGDGGGDGNGYGDGDGDGNGYGDGNGDGKFYVCKSTPLIGYHVVNIKGFLCHDLEYIKIKKGLTINFDNTEVKMCNIGLHASFNKEDAKSYKRNGILTKVSCYGWISMGIDKFVCSNRKIYLSP